MEAQATPDGAPRIDQHFDCIRANLIRCDECNENFFFDFLRHPRYFVTHFKTCHLKNVLYRFNGCSEEENQRVRFGPRRKKDATAWFSQLKSTEKRMISMQDNKWGEIAERECWSCRLCKHGRKSSELPHAFEPNELGRRQALLHLRQFHEAAYNAFLRMLPDVDSSSSRRHASGALPSHLSTVGGEEALDAGVTTVSLGLQAGGVGAQSAAQADAGGNALSPALTHKQSIEAERSRLRRMRATPETKRAEAERSRRRREQLTPAQRQADTERRARKRQEDEERKRSCQRRADASPEAKERELKRSRDRRQNATEQQRQREAQRSRNRRQNATEEQRLRERERCRRRYEARKQQKQADEELFDPDAQPRTPPAFLSDATSPPSSAASEPMTPPPRSRVQPADLERRNQQLLQQQAGLGQQIQSLYASLSQPASSSVEL